MQGKTINNLTILVAGCILMMSFSFGCQEAEPDRTTHQAMDQVQRAQRLYAQALSLMAVPPYTVKEDFPPLTRVTTVKSEDVQPVVSETVNPKALKLLEQAQNILKNAEKQTSPKSDERSLVYAMQGRVSMLRGQYFTGLSSDIRKKISAALARIDVVLTTNDSRMRVLSYLKETTAFSDDNVQSQISSAEQEDSTILKDIESKRSEIAQLDNQVKELNRKNHIINAQGREFLRESRAAESDKALELFRKFQEKRARSAHNEYEIAKLEARIAAMQGQIKMLELRSAAARDRIDVGKQLLSGYQEIRDVKLSAHKELLDSLIQTQRTVDSLLIEAGNRCDELQNLDGDAAGAYQLAANQFDKARRAQSRTGRPALLGQEAGALLCEGQVYLRCLEMQGRIDRIARELSRLRTDETTAPPSVPEKLKTYIPNPEVVVKDAQERFRKSEELYQTALTRVKGQEHEWVYEKGKQLSQWALRRSERFLQTQ